MRDVSCGWLSRQVLTSDGDLDDETRETWQTAQIMTGRDHYPNGEPNIVAVEDVLDDEEMVRFFNNGRLEGETDQLGSLVSDVGTCLFFSPGREDQKYLQTPGRLARVSHRVRGKMSHPRPDSLEEEPRPLEIKENLSASHSSSSTFTPGEEQLWTILISEKTIDLGGDTVVRAMVALADREAKELCAC